MNKVEAIQNYLNTNNLDMWLIVSNESSDINVNFLLDITLTARTYLIIPKKGNPTIFLANYEANMADEVLSAKNIQHNTIAYMALEDLMHMIPRVLDGHKIAINYGENLFSSTDGTPFANTLSVGDYFNLKSLCPNSEFFSAASLIEEIRGVKTGEDIKDFHEVVKATEEILDEIPNWFGLGMTEQDFKMKLESEYMKVGKELSFPSIIASSVHSANVHHMSSKKKITKGCLLIDSGFKINRMCSDITRTYWVGEKPPDEFLSAYHTLFAAKQLSFHEMIGGIPLKKPEIVIRNYLKEHNWDDKKYFIHGLGHPIGFECHDIGVRPTMNVSDTICYKVNQAFTNEPGIYIEGKWGLRLEDDVIIGKEKPTVLTHTPADIIML